MQKPDSLRAAITAALPQLARDPQQLLMMTQNGNVRGYNQGAGGDASFEHRYNLHIIMLQFAGDLALLSVTILQWLAVHQPDLVAARNAGSGNAFTFDVDILDNRTVDLEIVLALTENVRAVANAAGGFDMEYLPEPSDPLAEFTTSPINPDDFSGDFTHDGGDTLAST